MNQISSLFLQKICVEPPYFNLHDLKIDNQIVSATIFPEQPTGNEQSVIAMAEVGRHLAILGSCAVAALQIDNKKRFYLAKKALLSKLSDTALTSNKLTAEAVCTSLDKRIACANTKLLIDGNPAYTLQVVYQILEESLFQKIFKYLNADTEQVNYSPYKHNKEIVTKELGNSFLRATVGPLLAKDYAGHFKNYPAMPIAILCHIKVLSAEKLLTSILGIEKPKYQVISGEILAHTLIPINETIILDIKLEDTLKEKGNYTFICTSRYKEIIASLVKFTFKIFK